MFILAQMSSLFLVLFTDLGLIPSIPRGFTMNPFVRHSFSQLLSHSLTHLAQLNPSIIFICRRIPRSYTINPSVRHSFSQLLSLSLTQLAMFDSKYYKYVSTDTSRLRYESLCPSLIQSVTQSLTNSLS